MTAKSDGEPELERARRIGRHTATAVAVTTGVVLAGFALNNRSLLACLAGGTLVVGLFARSAGRLAGAQIASRPFIAAIGIGALGGAASLLVAALSAAGLGLIWGLFDGIRDSSWLYSYVGKPFLAVLSYGAIVALLLGIVTGLVIRGLLGHKNR